MTADHRSSSIITPRRESICDPIEHSDSQEREDLEQPRISTSDQAKPNYANENAQPQDTPNTHYLRPYWSPAIVHQQFKGDPIYDEMKQILSEFAHRPTQSKTGVIVASTQAPYARPMITDHQNQSRLSIATTSSGNTLATVLSETSTIVAAPMEKNIKLSKLEDQSSIWSEYHTEELPPKVQTRWMRNLRHQIYHIYHRLFSVIFVINFGVFVWYAVDDANSEDIGDVVTANLAITLLMRQEYVINGFYRIFTSVPPTWPLPIRKICAQVYHIGGLHSGAGFSGTLWMLYFAVRASREVADGEGATCGTLALAYAVLLLLIAILVFVYPPNRRRYHNTFETTHRFLGWAAALIGLGLSIAIENDFKEERTLRIALCRSASFWLSVIMIVSLLIPWLHLRKVSVRIERMSDRAVRLHFDYTTPCAGSFVRLSDTPLIEWHSFAAIPEPGKTGFSLVVYRAGDWTRKHVCSPPSQFWTRGIPTYGIMRIARLFNRLVLVATGSGIGPCTTAILTHKQPIRLLWAASNARRDFGDNLVDQILEANPEAVIYNTGGQGRPDMVKLTWRMVKQFRAEAVIIISNQELTEKVVYGMVSRGMPAFGAIWDS